jgi:hypothetical protein
MASLHRKLKFTLKYVTKHRLFDRIQRFTELSQMSWNLEKCHGHEKSVTATVFVTAELFGGLNAIMCEIEIDDETLQSDERLALAL